MDKYDHMRMLLELAYQLDRNEELSIEERKYLAFALARIGKGEDANKVLNLKLARGEKESDAIAGRRMSMILHWVACAVIPDEDLEFKGMSIEKACELACETIVPIAKNFYPGADKTKYDAEYIKRSWSEPANAHMRSPERGWFDPDFPYYQLPQVKDTK